MHIHGDEREPDIPLSPDSVTIHEFAIVPIELYGDHVARTKQESLGNKLREEPGWGREDAPQDDFASLEHLVDLDLLRELGIEVRRDRYARSMNDLENEGAPYSEYLFSSIDELVDYTIARGW